MLTSQSLRNGIFTDISSIVAQKLSDYKRKWITWVNGIAEILILTAFFHYILQRSKNTISVAVTHDIMIN